MLDLRWVMWSFSIPHGKHICEIWRHGLSTNSGDSYGHKLCSTHSGFVMLSERFMSNLHKSKQYNLIDMFNDTSSYLDDIFIIDNPEFEKHIPDIYPMEFQLNKVNNSDKKTSFLDLNIKVIGSDVHTSVYDKRDDFWFPIVDFPLVEWWCS